MVFEAGSNGFSFAMFVRVNVRGNVGAAKFVQSIPILEFTRMQLYGKRGVLYQSIVMSRYDPVGREVYTVKGKR